VTFEETVTVQVVSLEDWAAERGVERVDFLWLDMQGHEFAMLQTAERILETTSVIVMEVAFKELYEGAPLWGEVRPWLETRGFRVEAELTPWEDGGNAILVRNG
jgi:hypothetical protein